MTHFAVANEVSKTTSLSHPTLNNEVVNTENEKRRSRFAVVLEENVHYVGKGNAPDGSAFVIEDNEFFAGMNGLDWVCYGVAKVFVSARTWLPAELVDEVHRPNVDGSWAGDLREGVRVTICDCLSKGLTTDQAIDAAFAFLESELVRDGWQSKENKRLPKEVSIDAESIESATVLCSGNPLGLPEVDNDWVDKDLVFVIGKLFDIVKKAHPFASQKAWDCFKYFVLGYACKDIAQTVGLSSPKVSTNNSRAVKWLLEGLNELSPNERKMLKAHLKS